MKEFETNRFSISKAIAIGLAVIFMAIGKIDPYWGVLFIFAVIDFEVFWKK